MIKSKILFMLLPWLVLAGSSGPAFAGRVVVLEEFTSGT
jgi:hypothetical protein